MKYLIYLLVILSLTGCFNDKPIVPEIRYITKECPKPKAKPKFIEYELVRMKINGKIWYAFQESEAMKAALDWYSYKSWAEANAKLLEKKPKVKPKSKLEKLKNKFIKTPKKTSNKTSNKTPKANLLKEEFKKAKSVI